MRRATFVACCLLLLISLLTRADEGAVIFDMDTVRHKPGEFAADKNKRLPAGTVESVDGKFGKAVKFSFVENARGGFMIATARATKDWNDADGFSFWVKGDGSNSWAGLELIDKSDFKLRYGYCFPIGSTEWRKITVAWGDLTPELAAPLVDVKAGYAPANFGNFWFGKWFYYRDYPAHSFAIDQVVLERKIDPPATPKFEPGLTRLRAKLKAKQPVTIVTMGDSLSDSHHWANRKILWSSLLAADIKSKYGSDVKLINPAVGGTTLTQNLITLPRWLKEDPHPDLVTIWFGGNDYDNGVRGERFKQYLRLAVDRIREKTDGRADVLLMTTAPTHARWETYGELEQAAKDVARETGVALVDTAGEFRKAGTADDALKQKYWEWDKVHLGQKGHEVAKEAVLRAVAEE
jgi:lysophospholipase L1-like esterase